MSIGKNNLGQLIFYHRGGGYKRKYRIINFKQKFINVLGIIKLIIYNPIIKNNIILICYLNGILIFNLLIKNLKINYFIKNFTKNIYNGSLYFLYQLPIGSYISLLNYLPNKKLQLIRSSSTKGHILSKTNNLYSIKLPSKKLRFFSNYCKAIFGIINLNLYKFLNKLKAGKNKNLNKKSIVRGVAMNPIDHPHGGGQGKTSGGRKMSVSPCSKYTKVLKSKKKKKKIKLYL